MAVTFPSLTNNRRYYFYCAILHRKRKEGRKTILKSKGLRRPFDQENWEIQTTNNNKSTNLAAKPKGRYNVENENTKLADTNKYMKISEDKLKEL